MHIIGKAADTLISQLGKKGVDQVGGSKWWQWRRDPQLKAEWIEMRSDYAERRRKGGKGRRVMLYVHGGAYFFGSVDEHRYQLQRHARKLRARVFAPRYRLAPQFPFPCGLHDCLAAYLYLLTMQEPEEIVLAGDSAGGGMVVSMLVTLRDQGLPLPAGAVLISPWVDLTHSFPSVAGGNELDYIPAHGFMQRPSPSWPPLSQDEMLEIARGHTFEALVPMSPLQKEGGVQGIEIMEGSVIRAETGIDSKTARDMEKVSDRDLLPANIVTGGSQNLSIKLDGNLVILKEQIQMYATNQLISHPLVSPILQPSLGGLPPLLILTGGGEVLRDEQIYLAHKAANPEKYALVDVYQTEYDPNHENLNKYKPTNVQLQLWDHLCHVAPTLSFTRPAKFMYRSIAQFSAWALARAQHRSIEITDDDDVSVISSGSETESVSSTDLEKLHAQNPAATAHVGRAGDLLLSFKNHMIRQQVDRHGIIRPMAPESELPALQMPAADVGVIKPGPVRKWLAARKEWDTRYASEKRKVQKQRIKDMTGTKFETFGDEERPPPSALAGRRKKGHVDSMAKRRKNKGWGMMLWSLWGSKHDQSTIRREEEMVDEDQRAKTDDTAAHADSDLEPEKQRPTSTPSRRHRPRTNPRTKSAHTEQAENDLSRTRSRKRTVTVSDQGQTETDAFLEQLRRDQQDANTTTTDREHAATAKSSPSGAFDAFLSPP
jgi:acetyl esterase/lipase